MKNQTSSFAVTAMLVPLLAFALPLWGADSPNEKAEATEKVSGIGSSSTTQGADALTESIVWQSGDPLAAMQGDDNRWPRCTYDQCLVDADCKKSGCYCQGGSGPAPDPTAPPGGRTGNCYGKWPGGYGSAMPAGGLLIGKTSPNNTPIESS